MTNNVPAPPPTISYAYIDKYDFASSIGSTPYGNLIQAADGNFYGTTSAGGANGDGIIFKWSPTSGYTDEYDFNGSGGSYPSGSLVQAADGKFYGMAQKGGAHSAGAIFQWSPGSGYIDEYDFTGTAGSAPYGNLIQATDGKFYGLTSGGGAHSGGVIFKWSLSDGYTDEYDFDVDAGGASPHGSLVQGTDGNLYGLTYTGSDLDNNCGSIFKWSLTAGYAEEYEFGDADTGCAPYLTSLIQATDGNFYGMTYQGGSGNGDIFEWNPSSPGVVNDKYDFTGSTGSDPLGSLIQATDGNFYGMTFLGGAHNKGVIFKWNLTGGYTDVYDFDGTNGSTPYGDLVQATDGNFYGTASDGGANNLGVIFEYGHNITTNASGTTVSITFNKAMASPAGDQSQFTVHVGAGTDTVTAAALHAGDNTTIDLTLTTPILHGQTVTVDYTAGTVTAADTGILASFSGQSVTNNSTVYAPPTVSSAATNASGTTVSITFNKAMASPAGDQSQFTVHVDAGTDTVTAAALHAGDNTTIDLTLTTPILHGQTVTVDYTAGTVTSADTGILCKLLRPVCD